MSGTGADRVELPGGHAGFISHPEAFVALVRRTARQGAANRRPHHDGRDRR